MHTYEAANRMPAAHGSNLDFARFLKRCQREEEEDFKKVLAASVEPPVASNPVSIACAGSPSCTHIVVTFCERINNLGTAIFAAHPVPGARPVTGSPGISSRFRKKDRCLPHSPQVKSDIMHDRQQPVPRDPTLVSPASFPGRVQPLPL